MKVYLAADHAGFNLKEKVKESLLKDGLNIKDCGAFIFDKNDDYPDFVAKAAEKVSKDNGAKGIIFGKSGAGECIAANKIKGIRSALGFSEKNVELSRLHNDVNVLSLGSEFVSLNQALELIKIFLGTSFSNEKRHKRRIVKITKLENVNRV